MKALAAAIMLAACATTPPAAPLEPEPPCRIRPMAITDRDFLTPETLREIRRINREAREQCAR